MVGVTDFLNAADPPLPLLKIDAGVEHEQAKRVQAVRARRDAARVAATLTALRHACEGADNVMPRLLDCAHAYCTLNEIMTTMKAVFGEYHDPGIF